MRIAQCGSSSRVKPTIRALTALAALLLSSGLANAKDSDVNGAGSSQNETGYNRDSVYASIDGAQINAFNFNYVAQFPLAIGLTYPENAGLTLQLNLTYNSKVAYWWRYGLHRHFLRSRRQNPFGLGFDLTLGRIVTSLANPAAPYTYVDSSGAMHKLAPLVSGSNEYHTHDGSHIRAVLATNGVWTVSFPTGLVQELGQHVSGSVLTDVSDSYGPCNPDTDPPEIPCPADKYLFVPDNSSGLGTGFDRDYIGWHVTKVYSRAAINATSFPSYTVEYYGSDASSANYPYVIKNITDQFGRTIHFDLDATRGVVDQISTPAPADENGIARTATYLLDYEQRSSAGRVAWYLVKLSGPDVSSSGSPQRYVHLFDYRTAGNDDSTGQLSSVRYPSGILVQLSYVQYPYLNGGPGYCIGYGGSGDPNDCNAATGGGTCSKSWGVNRIDKYLNGDTSSTITGNHLVTTFAQTTTEGFWQPVGSNNCPESPSHYSGYWRYDQVHTMVDPAQNATQMVFKTSKEHDDMQVYGLLDREYQYGGQPGGANALVKSIFHYYDVTPLDSYAFTYNNQDFEMPPIRLITTWPDDQTESGAPLSPVTMLREDRSQWDKFGHYQRAVFSGTAVGTVQKVVVKDYAADDVDANGQPCQYAQYLQDAWLGDVVARDETRAISSALELSTSRVDYGFDTSRGIRTLAVQRWDPNGPITSCADPPPIANGDPSTSYSYFDSGDLSSQTQSLGSVFTGSPTQLTTTFSYSFGARESIKQAPLSYFDSFRIIDPASGLVTRERVNALSSNDTTAETTSFVYDMLGRTTKVSHGTDDPIYVAYENDPEATPWPTPIAPAVRLARVRLTQGTALAQTESVDHFVAGRLDHEEKLTALGGRAYRYRGYDEFGRPNSLSEWSSNVSSSGVPATVTSYAVTNSSGSFQEPLGRPTSVTDSLGGVTTYRYFGLNKEVTMQGVALKAAALDDPAAVRTKYYTDAFGNLRVVSKPVVANPGTGPYEETGAGGVYTYDMLGRLTQALTSASVTLDPSSSDRFNAIVGSSQQRSWSYDALGHLASSSTPESGTVTNLNWNVLGQVTLSQDALDVERSTRHYTAHDAVGRVVNVERLYSAPWAINTYNAGDSTWDMHGAWRYDSQGSCLQTGGVAHPAWYIGSTSCQYATSGTTGALDLDSPSIPIYHGMILTFKYFREVRDEVGTAGNHDRFSVKVQDQANTNGPWTEVYFQDSSQVSWPKWVTAPAIELDAWSGKNVKIRFEFDSVNQNASPSLRGVGISQVVVQRNSLALLQSRWYDEAPSASCNTRGKLTTIVDFDATQGPAVFTRKLNYCEPNTRLSDEVLSLDWDRDGVYQTFVDSYDYDSLGNIQTQRMPHPQGSSTRRYDFAWWHGTIRNVTETDESTGVGQYVIPGINYNEAGGMSLISFGNDTEEIDSNAAFLPSRMTVQAVGLNAPSWDSGDYIYDGARNIKQVGQDYYRYDTAMRLTWARINTSQQGVVDLDQSFDAFGNMTAQSGTQSGSYTAALPTGMTFSNRSYSSNRIVNAGFTYDANGNAKDEPAHDGLTAQSYSFTAENQLARVTPGPTDSHPGTAYQSALYEGGDHRWFRSTWADGSKALLTLRDASGQVAADYLESNGSSGLQLQREYVHANGQLMAINSTCGPRPALSMSGSSNGLVWFDKIDYVPAVGSYSMYIRTNTGQTKSISLPLPLANHFSVAQTEFFANDTNWIQIETDAACGHTGYSNAVSYAYTSGGCLGSMTGNRFNFNGSGSSLKAFAIGSCPTGTTYNVYYVDPNAEATELVPLNATPVSDPSQVLTNMPCGSGDGNYWVRAISPTTQHETVSSPVVEMNGTSCGGGAGPSVAALPGQPSMNLQYIHWDHLGSTRLVTDENGMTVASFKYYPFGMEAESSGGDELRQKFTGHERDDRVGLDYMLARKCRPALGRFLRPDPADSGSAFPGDPQRWNKYAYAANSPIQYVDRDGREVEVAVRRVFVSADVHTFIVVKPTGVNVKLFGKAPIVLSGFPEKLLQPGLPLGRLIQTRNDDRDTKSKPIARFVVNVNGMSTEQLERRVLAAAGAYKDNLPYQLYPQPIVGGYNSNSFTSGVLAEAGATRDDLAWLEIAIHDVTGFRPTGFEKPIPYNSSSGSDNGNDGSDVGINMELDPTRLDERMGNWVKILSSSAFQ